MREVKATTTKLVALKNIYVVARMILCNGEYVEQRNASPLVGPVYKPTVYNRNSSNWNP
jgi:hypothetical protein